MSGEPSPQVDQIHNKLENVAAKLDEATPEQESDPKWLSNLETSLKSLADQVKALADLPRTQSAEMLAEIQSLRAELRELKEMAIVEPEPPEHFPTPDPPNPDPPQSSSDGSEDPPEAKPDKEKAKVKKPKPHPAPPAPAARREKRWI